MFDGLKEKKLFPKLPYQEISADWYDEDYFSSNGKSNWRSGYTWETHGAIFQQWARFVVWAFPEAKRILDVGCAMGFLERSITQLWELHNMDRTIHGFDHSRHAISNCLGDVSGMVSLAGVDDFVFTDNYDLMVSFDVFEHLTEEQARLFLSRSRTHIDDALLFIIALDHPEQRDEPSHINLRSREWWHEMFLSCGWRQDRELQGLQDCAVRHRAIKNTRTEPFIYGSR